MSIIINQESFKHVAPLKITDLQPGKAYLLAGVACSAVIFGCNAAAETGLAFTVYGIDTNGDLWHSGDTSARFVEVDITISGRL